MRTNKINRDFLELTALSWENDKEVRIATQQRGWARIYFGSDLYVSFRSNNMNSKDLIAAAHNARQSSHLGQAMVELINQVEWKNG